MTDVVGVLRECLRGRGDIEVAVLFGSRARGTARADSDVDLAVLGRSLDLLSLARELGLRLGLTVDLVALSDPGVPLLEELIRDGRVIHEGRPGAGARWRSFALATLETDRPWYGRMRDAWLLRVAREGV